MDTTIFLEMAMGFTLWAIAEIAERLFDIDEDQGELMFAFGPGVASLINDIQCVLPCSHLVYNIHTKKGLTFSDFKRIITIENKKGGTDYGSIKKS